MAHCAAALNHPYTASLNRHPAAGPLPRTQVNCNPPGPLMVHVDQYRPTSGGFLKLALKDVAGNGDIAAVSLTPSQARGAPCR